MELSHNLSSKTDDAMKIHHRNQLNFHQRYFNERGAVTSTGTSIHERSRYSTIMLQKLIIPTILILCTSIGAVSAVPLVYEIKKGQTECLYDTLEENEFMTMSVFIVDGDDLRGTGYIQGPVAPNAINTAKHLINSVAKYDRNPNLLDINDKFHIDMEHILDHYDDDDNVDDEYYEDDDALDDIYYNFDDDDLAQFEEDDNMDDEERAEMRKYKEEWEARPTEEREAEKAERRKDMEEAREEIMKMREERQKRKEKKQNRKMKENDDDYVDEVDSVKKTHKVRISGWYKVCVEAAYSGISVELEMRKSSELGQPNSKTGHLQSYERRAMIQEERRLFHKNTLKMNKDKGEASEKSLEDKDLDLTRQQLQRLNRLLNEIREKQQNERHRLAVHSATNEHSHSRMVLGSLFETVFYMVVSGFQVYTIRKWFSGAPMLGF